jgi:hypothetical protein
MNYKLMILAPALALGGCVVAPQGAPPPGAPQQLGCQMQGTAIACQQPDGTWNVAAAPPPEEAAPAPPPPEQDQQPPPPPPQYQYAPQPYPYYPPPPPPGYYGGGYNNGY